MFETEGFGELSKNLSELQKLANEIDGELGVIQFNAESAESIELAIVEMENMVGKKFESYGSNSIARNMAEGIKKSYRQIIIDKATEARAEIENEEKDDGC